jgi:adenosylmethionine-8-amino-7-oxononanoate aminotransferase
MQGVRALCDEYGILMHVDEVMVGFGRTGELFGFQNYEGVLPDIVSAAKGISSASIPLSMTACNSDIMTFFDDKPLGWGSTYQAHPVALACAYENIKYLLQHNFVGRVQAMAPLFEANIQQLADRHPSIKQYRAIGMFGCMDIHDTTGKNPKLQHHAPHEAFLKYKKAYAENGLVGLHRYPHVHCAPPLNITEDQLLDGFDRLDRALFVLDDALGYDRIVEERIAV